MNLEEIKAAIMRLSPEELAELREWLDAFMAPMPEWQEQELDLRLDDLERNPHTGSSWPEARARILARSGNSGSAS